MNVAVVGAGVVGLSTSVALRNLGADVICFEKTRPMAERSAGRSRIFRLAHRNVELVKLARRARAGFDRWADQAGTPLVDTSECVISGSDLPAWASAMHAAEAPFSLVGPDSEQLRLPVRVPPAELLVDHSGGVVDVDAVADLLVGMTRTMLRTETVYAVEHVDSGARLRTSAGSYDFDAVIVSAGAGTCSLAAQVGLYTPSVLAHHVRFAFPLRKPGPFQCWIDTSEGVLHTYHHHSGPDQWAVGGQVDLDKTVWERGKDQAIAASRELVVQYVRDYLDGVETAVVDQLYCTKMPGYGDGFRVLRNRAVLAVYGENLFKHAPVLGELVAQQALEGAMSDEAVTVYAV